MHPYYSHIKQQLSDFYPDSEASSMAKWILTDVVHLSTIDLYAGKDMNFSADITSRVEDILARLKRYEPLQYIVGETSFNGCDIEVSPAVLIPRPETVELVDWIVSDASKSGLRILDVGTGSGCIPIALAKRLDNPIVSAWDISSQALEVARKNAHRNEVSITFSQVDALHCNTLDVQVDILVSNPPYIGESEKKQMDANVLDWEPGLALFVPDSDPLIFYRKIAEIGLKILSPEGALYYEINQLYGTETVELLERMGYREVELRKDFYGNDRMIKALRP